MSARKPVTELVVGAPPRVDLLPPEVRERERDRAAAGVAVLAIVIAVGVVGAGYAVGAVRNLAAQTQLNSVSNRTQLLLDEQSKFAEVEQIKGRLDLAAAGQRVGAASMTDWGAVVSQISAVLPGTVGSFRGDVASPLDGYPQTTVPLQGPRLGGMQVTVRTTTLPDVSAWMDALATLEFVVDVATGTISVQEDGSYLTDLTLNLNEKAISNPFAPVDEESDQSANAEGASSEEGGNP